VAVVAIAGGCRCDELVKMCITDIEDKGDLLLIHIPFTKTHKKRSFTMLSTGFGINPINLYRKYINLRPKKLSTMRLFLCYRSGKRTVQPVGINSFGKMPELIATFLKLENSKMYTGHAFRRSAATLLSDCGADVRTLKRFGGWKSDTVVEGYVEDSLQNKIGIAKKILGNESSSSTSIVNHEITIVEQNKEAGFNADKEIYFNNTNCTINVTINKN
jgi:integrase